MYGIVGSLGTRDGLYYHRRILDAIKARDGPRGGIPHGGARRAYDPEVETQAWRGSGVVLIWAVTPASSRRWSRQDGGATPKLGQHLGSEIRRRGKKDGKA
jgi:hypothetical protein